MADLATTIARLELAAASEAQIAFHRGAIARAHNRPNEGCLVPKLSPEHLARWQEGWKTADGKLA